MVYNYNKNLTTIKILLKKFKKDKKFIKNKQYYFIYFKLSIF